MVGLAADRRIINFFFNLVKNARTCLFYEFPFPDTFSNECGFGRTRL